MCYGSFPAWRPPPAPVTEEKEKQRICRRLAALYPQGHCGDFTQALMELGAIVCLPNGAPRCELCPAAALCRARAAGTQQSYPVKTKKKPRRREERTVFVLHCGDLLAVCRRPAKGLLAGLWQLPDISGTLAVQEALEQAAAWGVHPASIEKSVRRNHIFTHVEWLLTGYYLTCSVPDPRFTWASPAALREEIGLPTAYRQFLEE